MWRPAGISILEPSCSVYVEGATVVPLNSIFIMACAGDGGGGWRVMGGRS